MHLFSHLPQLTFAAGRETGSGERSGGTETKGSMGCYHEIAKRRMWTIVGNVCSSMGRKRREVKKKMLRRQVL